MTARKVLLAPLATLALAAGLAQAPATMAADVQSGNYKIEPYHTQVLFSLDHFGFTNFNGAFSNASGSLVLNADQPAQSKIDITVPTDSIQTTVPKLTDELKGSDWFNVSKYPKAHFVSSKVTSTGDDTAKVEGQLTLKGVTKPATLNVRFHGAGVNPLDKAYTAGFEATTTIKRSEYGITKYVPSVGDNVTLKIEGAFEKQK